jgi:glycosyltransferase involved in cell wall biosynthesis
MNDLTKNKVIGVAFGDPLMYQTFSGYSRHLFTAMGQINCLAGLESSKLLKVSDLFRGCISMGPLLEYKKPNLSAHWLWNPVTIKKFSERLSRKIVKYGEVSPVLQVGTHVYPVHTDRLFYCITDMTIKQAVMAEQFRIKHLSGMEVSKAIQVQKHIFDTHEKIFVLCDWTRQSVIEDYDQPAGKVIVTGAGANMPPLEPAKEKYSSHEILFVGFDWIRKGGPLLLEAFETIKKKIPDAVLNIVGCSPNITMPGVNVIGILKKSCREECQKLELLYRRANCFCILPQFDPFPNVLLEAGITSTPVVSLKNGSRADAVREGQTGMLIETAKAAHVAEALVYILSNPDVAERMGQAARKFIGENYTWPSIARKLIQNIFGRAGLDTQSDYQPAAVEERT